MSTLFRPLAATMVAPLFLVVASAAQAQVVERNLPPVPTPQGQSLPTPNALPTDQDESPIGPALAGIVLLDAGDAPLAAASPGVDVSRVARLNNVAAQHLLGSWLGQPMSRRSIADIEAAIARYYRDHGFPFVALSTPEQELTSGILQIRVVEFKAGAIKVTGNKTSSADYIRHQVRTRTGEPIDADQLREDLDWLGRNPFRQAQALFSPGDSLGSSDLTLALDEARPWRIYGGVANSGSEATGWLRMFAGFQVAPLKAMPDAIFSYQFTGSNDVFDRAHPAYLSHAGILNLGIAPRQAIELTIDHVETNQFSDPFAIRQKTDEAILGWRGGVGKIGDLRLGVELRRSTRTVSFDDMPIIAGKADIFQFYAGVETAGTDPLGNYSFSATIHVSPGGINAANSATALAAYTSGRVTDDRYVYLDAHYARSTRLGRGFTLGTEITAKLASAPLPDTEQFGFGGADLVRGYALDDGAFDTGVVLRNTLSLPAVPLLGPVIGSNDALQPYVFLDAAYAHDRFTGANAKPASVGVGSSYRLGRIFSGRMDLARALNSTAYTHAGDWRAQASATVSF